MRGLCAISIGGLPWSRACFMFGGLCFSFGREVMDRREYTGRSDIGTRTLGFLGRTETASPP
jgi:uncharacterized membrane protein YccF (DUF307 family)